MTSTMKISENGDKMWYNSDGKLHRDDALPAVERSNGDKEWWIDGVKRWYFFKRNTVADLPSIEFVDGTKVWIANGEIHRDGGLPAIEKANGEKEWYLNGVRYFPDGDN
jgi:hypothetical protein